MKSERIFKVPEVHNMKEVIYNAVKKDFYDIAREPNWRRIVTCGRLQPQKNHKLLISFLNKEKKNG